LPGAMKGSFWWKKNSTRAKTFRFAFGKGMLVGGEEATDGRLMKTMKVAPLEGPDENEGKKSLEKQGLL